MTEDEDNIIRFPGLEDDDWTEVEILREDDKRCEPDDVINALMGEMTSLTVIGINKDGEEILASSLNNICDINYMLDRIKHRIISRPED